MSSMNHIKKFREDSDSDTEKDNENPKKSMNDDDNDNDNDSDDLNFTTQDDQDNARPTDAGRSTTTRKTVTWAEGTAEPKDAGIYSDLRTYVTFSFYYIIILS